MGKRHKKDKGSGDYEQFRANLEFIEKEIEAAQHRQQRKEVTRLKLKRLVMKLSYGAQLLEKREIESKDKQDKRNYRA